LNRRPGEQATEPVSRILVRCPNWLGDVVMTTPGLRALRTAYPEAWIVVQAPEALWPILEGSRFCDALWPVTPRRAGLRALRAEARAVRDARFDLGIVIPESISSALRMRWGRVGRITGFARDPIRRRLLDRVISAPRNWGRRRLVSKERFVLKLMEAVGAGSADTRLELAVTPADEARLVTHLADHDLRLEDLVASPPIVVAPGSGFGESKRWPAESYAELADRLGEQGRRVVIVGGPGEGAVLDAIRAGLRSKPIIFDGTIDLGCLKALIRLACLVVSNDAGARHLAAAFATPSVVFFGPTSVAKTPDNLDAVEILETDHDCRPCYRRTCPIDHRCLRSISVDEADEAAQRALGRARGTEMGRLAQSLRR
jgi:heptosyltransferase-2